MPMPPMAVMPKGRLEAFSDGVLAVAITLLVLDLQVKQGQSLGHQVREQWPQFAAYAVSFLIIGTIWINHHALFAVAASVDQVVMLYNLILLMFVCTVPFTTEALADFLNAGATNARYAVLLYGVSMEGMALSFTLIFRRLIAKQLLIRPISAAVGRRALLRFGAGSLIYPVGFLIGLVSPQAMLVGYGLLAVYYAMGQRAMLPDEATDTDQGAGRVATVAAPESGGAPAADSAE